MYSSQYGQTGAGYGRPGGHAAFISVPISNPYGTNLTAPPSYTPQPVARPMIPLSVPSSANRAPTSGGGEARRKQEWSPDVRSWVGRCFAEENEIAGISRKEVETRLREVITQAVQSGMIDHHNWATMPLAQQMIQDDRKRTAFMAAFPPPPPPSSLPFAFPPPGFPPPPLPPVPTQNGEVLRKRKSSDMNTPFENVAAVPPWRAKKGGALEDRMTKPEKRAKFDSGNMSKSHTALDSRKKRFDNERTGSTSPAKASPAPSEPLGPVVGLSQKLEKNYFRLTSAPKPEDVRPLPILKQTLDLLTKKWKDDCNYAYICDQFKSLRQDLTVQHIKNEFTTKVYEIHARIALEKGDLGEYNQCQTQLRALYRQDLGGHPIEFKAYRILYTIYTCNRTDMSDLLNELTTADKATEAIKHALDVRRALALGNYHRFFQLYLIAPNMGGYLLDMFVERERLAALAVISKVYKPSVRLSFLTKELGFEEDDEQAAQFIVDHGGKELLEEKDDHMRVLTSTRLWEDLKQKAFSGVDIKGQI